MPETNDVKTEENVETNEAPTVESPAAPGRAPNVSDADFITAYLPIADDEDFSGSSRAEAIAVKIGYLSGSSVSQRAGAMRAAGYELPVLTRPKQNGKARVVAGNSLIEKIRKVAADAAKAEATDTGDETKTNSVEV